MQLLGGIKESKSSLTKADEIGPDEDDFGSILIELLNELQEKTSSS